MVRGEGRTKSSHAQVFNEKWFEATAQCRLIGTNQLFGAHRRTQSIDLQQPATKTLSTAQRTLSGAYPSNTTSSMATFVGAERKYSFTAAFSSRSSSFRTTTDGAEVALPPFEAFFLFLGLFLAYRLADICRRQIERIIR